MPLPTEPHLSWPPPSVPTLDFAVWGEWYSGDFSPAGSEYSTIPVTMGGVTERLTGGFVHRHPNIQTGSTTNPRPGSQPVHCPLAGDIAQASADLLFSEMPNIRIADKEAEASEKRLTQLLDRMGAQNILLEAAEPCSALGGTYLRVAWDKAFADYPFITSVDADRAVPEFTWAGRLRAVTFWREVEGEGKSSRVVYRHLERHEPGVILHGLFQGTKSSLGSSVPLDQSDETTGLPKVILLPDALKNHLAVSYVPNVRPNRRHRSSYLGRADIGGAEPFLDALDETWSSLMRDVRLAQARILTPRGALDSNKPDDPHGAGSSFDLDREVFTEIDVPPEGLKLEVQQPDIRSEQLLAVTTDQVKQIVSAAGYSPQTFGLDISGEAHSGTALRFREQKTYRTLGRKRRYWETGISQACFALLAVDQAEFGGGASPAAPVTEWPEEAMSLGELASTVQMLRLAEAMSIETAVRKVNPDWDDKAVKAEVDRIMEERGTTVPEPAF